MSAKPNPAPVGYFPMQPPDLDAVVAAEATLYEFPWSRVNFEDSLAAGYSAWVCRSGTDLVGYAVMMLVLDEAHLLNISVTRDWQGRGCGRALLDFACGVARCAGARALFLEVRPSNTVALGLYRDYGFTEIGRRRGYYPAKLGREDALVMSVAL